MGEGRTGEARSLETKRIKREREREGEGERGREGGRRTNMEVEEKATVD